MKYATREGLCDILKLFRRRMENNLGGFWGGSYINF